MGDGGLHVDISSSDENHHAGLFCPLVPQEKLLPGFLEVKTGIQKNREPSPGHNNCRNSRRSRAGILSSRYRVSFVYGAQGRLRMRTGTRVSVLEEEAGYLFLMVSSLFCTVRLM